MKNISKISLLTSILLSTSLYADSLKEAFADSKIQGEIKTAYSSSNFLGKSSTDNVWAIGGSLGIKTGNFNGFSTGVTFQSTSVINEDNDNNAKLNQELDISDTSLSEIYLQYDFQNTSLKAGRQFIYTPLVSTTVEGKSSESIIKDSFEAYSIINKDIPNTTIMATYIDKHQLRNDGEGDIGDFEEDGLEDGAYSIYLENQSIKNLTLSGQYLDINAKLNNQDKEIYYFQADYKLGAHTLSAQYINSDVNSKNANFYAVKATGPLGISNLAYLAAFSTNTKDTSIDTGIGEGTIDTTFTAMPVHGGAINSRSKTDTIIAAIIVPIKGLTFIPYAGKAMRDVGNNPLDSLGDVTATGAMVIYPINKNFLFQVKHEHINTEKAIGNLEENTDTTRVYLSYKF